MKKRTTINDIAKDLNITAATVSRALSNRPEISANTKKLVRASALRLNYNVNKIASSLRSGKTKVIGVLIPTAEHIFFGSVIHGISNVASKNGYDVLIFQSNESQDFEIKGVERFLNARVDGILASVSKNTTDFSHFIKAQESGTPVAFFDRINDEIGISSVCIDDYRGAYLATESLFKGGYKKIAHIAGPLQIKTFSERLRGYRDALAHHKLQQHEDWIYEGDVSMEAGQRAVEQFFDQDTVPDAIFAVEDFSALGALKALKAKNILIPEQVGLFGFCNDLFGQHISPSLSSVDQQTVLMGEEAFDLIFKMINSDRDELPVQKKILQPLLMLRESSTKKQK